MKRRKKEQEGARESVHEEEKERARGVREEVSMKRRNKDQPDARGSVHEEKKERARGCKRKCP